MVEKIKIACDIDGVVFPLMKGFCEFYNNKYGGKISPEDLPKYHISNIIGGTHEEAVAKFSEYYQSDFFNDTYLIEGVAEYFKVFAEDKEIYFITSRKKNEIGEKTKQFLERHFSNLDYSLFFSGEIFNEDGQEKRKDELCKELGVKLIFEDNGEHSLTYAENGLKVILLDKPWNQNVEHSNIFRVGGWKSAVEKVEELIKSGELKNG